MVARPRLVDAAVGPDAVSVAWVSVPQTLRGDVVSVFILPPSMAELKARLKRRAEDSDATISTRLDNARREIEQWRKYDYVIVNDDLDRAFSAVKAIVQAERLRRDRRHGLFEFVTGLLDEKIA